LCLPREFFTFTPLERSTLVPCAQALLTALEARAYEVGPAEDGVRVTVLDEPLAIAIAEETKKVEHRVSFTEQKLIDRGLG
jgi:hypothetical protein